MNRGIHRETVARYDRLRQSKPANPTPGSGDEDLSKPANATPGSIPPGGNLGPPSYCQPFAEIIKRKLETGLSGQWIWQDLVYPICRLVKCYTSGLLLTSFYCPADACRASVPDVTKLVTKFHGLANITPCPDYSPAWPTPDDLPVEAPSGWPNCETPPVSSKIINDSSVK